MADEEPLLHHEQEEEYEGESSSELEENQRGEPETLISVWQGHHLHCHQWGPLGTPRAMLCLVHGVTEHLGRYDKLAHLLADNGIMTYGIDLVGHGLSEGDRVHVESVDTYVEDVIRCVEQMKTQHPNTPSLLMGHSMGGLIASHVAVRRQELFSALILSAPPVVGRAFPLLSVMRAVIKCLAYLVPRVPLLPWSANRISTLREEVEAFQADHLIYHGLIRFGWVAAILDAIDWIQQRVHEISLPLLLIHGTDDEIVPITASEFAFNNVSSQDKTFERFEGHRHEVLHDRDQERARQLIKDWILDHLSPPPQPQEQTVT